MILYPIQSPARRAGRPRCQKTYLVALEYIMHPERHYGMFKELAHGNGISLGQLGNAVKRIRERVKEGE